MRWPATPHPDGRSSLSSLTASAYILASIVGAFSTGNTEFVFYIAVMLVLIAFVSVVHVKVGLPGPLLWGLTAWGAMHMAGGLVPVPESWPIDGDIRVVYSWWIIPSQSGGLFDTGGWLKYDQVTHAFGFGLTTWLSWCALRGALRERAGGDALRPTAGLLTLCAVAGMGFGALNEVVEFMATRFAETNVGGYVNTGLDLVYNMLGCVIAAVIIRILDRP